MAREILQRLVVGGRVPNALLFAGPEGVGKKEFAIELARSFVCQRPNAELGCGECAACRRAGEFSIPTFEKGPESDRVFFGQHPDVGLVVPFRRNLRIDAIRALEREANFRPFEGRARFFIVDEADKMNDASSNALLKTLEEPPATSHIVLMASREDTLLPTIRSRCQIIRFAPVSAQEIEQHLIATADFAPEDAALAAHVSGGSVGRALNIVPASFRTQRAAMLDVARAAVTGNRRELLQISEEINDARSKDELDEKLDVLEALVHDVWLLRNQSADAEIKNVDIRPELLKLAAEADSKTLAKWMADIEVMHENLIVNINRKIATDSLFIGMAAGRN